MLELISNYPVLAPSLAAIIAIIVACLLMEMLPLVGGRDQSIFPRN